jgi:hypothetical protein
VFADITANGDVAKVYDQLLEKVLLLLHAIKLLLHLNTVIIKS